MHLLASSPPTASAAQGNWTRSLEELEKRVEIAPGALLTHQPARPRSLSAARSSSLCLRDLRWKREIAPYAERLPQVGHERHGELRPRPLLVPAREERKLGGT